MLLLQQPVLDVPIYKIHATLFLRQYLITFTVMFYVFSHNNKAVDIDVVNPTVEVGKVPKYRNTYLLQNLIII